MTSVLNRAVTACVGAGLGLLLSGAPPLTAAPARARRPMVRSRMPWPVVMPPSISLSTAGPKYRAAEARLAQFIQDLQLGRRGKASALLSSHVNQDERQALIEKRWLRKNLHDRRDFTQLLFLPDLQIRTREFGENTAVCYVLPRTAPSKKSKLPTGYLPIRMRREENKWYVEMHPGKTTALLPR